MQKQIAAAACGVVLVAVAWTAVPRGADAPVWNPRAAPGYLDQRADWWRRQGHDSPWSANPSRV